MTDDKGKDAQSPAHSPIAKHVEQYKKYIRSLKTGTPSGISEAFGFALDLLPEDALAKYKGFQLGESTLGPDGDPAALRQALEELITEGLSVTSEQTATFIDGQEVVGVTFWEGVKYLVLADGNMVEAPVEPRAQEIAGPDSRADTPAEGQSDVEATNSSRQVSPAEVHLLESAAQTSTDESIPDASEIEESVLQLQGLIKAGTDDLGNVHPGDVIPPGANKPDQIITNRKGESLWSVHYADNSLERIIFHGSMELSRDGKTEEYTTHDLRNRIVDRVKSIVIDPNTGNVSYTTLDGHHSTIWMNNGCRIDSYQMSSGEIKYYLLDPTGLNQIEITRVTFDNPNNSISYETADGDQIATIKSRRLSAGE